MDYLQMTDNELLYAYFSERDNKTSISDNNYSTKFENILPL